MKSLTARLLAALVVVVAAWLALAGAAGTRAAQPDKLVILSTVDVKGRTGPCG